MTPANMTQEETRKVNTDHCKHIANTLESYAYGQMWRCEECGEIVNDADYPDFDGSIIDTCPHCGEEATFEQLSVYDWLDDALDVNYVVSSNGHYMHGLVMVAYGGPSIYVNTRSCEVELYWWADRANYPITRAACDELDAALEELFTSMC